MTTIAIIPARGGSKGVPRKNLQTINGETLVARAIRTTMAARLVDAVYVSTEDAEIKAESLRCGANVITRPDALARDESLTDDVIVDAVCRIGHGDINCTIQDIVQIVLDFSRSSNFSISHKILFSQKAKCL